MLTMMRRIPVCDRIELQQAKFSVPFELPRVGPGGRLISANAGNPGTQAQELFLQRLYFPQLTALIRLRSPQGFAIPRRLLSRCQFRMRSFHQNSLALFDSVDQAIGLRTKEIRTQRRPA